MFSWSQNQFMKQDYVFGVLCAIWSTLWLLVIMLKHKNHPKTLIKLNRKVIQVSKICYHGQRIDFSHKVLFWMCHLHYGVHYDCRWLCRNMKFILKSFCKNLWAFFVSWAKHYWCHLHYLSAGKILVHERPEWQESYPSFYICWLGLNLWLCTLLAMHSLGINWWVDCVPCTSHVLTSQM